MRVCTLGVVCALRVLPVGARWGICVLSSLPLGFCLVLAVGIQPGDRNKTASEHRMVQMTDELDVQNFNCTPARYTRREAKID